MTAIASNAVALTLPGAGAPGVANAAGQVAGPLAGFEALLAALFPQADSTVAVPTAGAAVAVNAKADALAGDTDKDALSETATGSLADPTIVAPPDPNVGLAASLAATPAAVIVAAPAVTSTEASRRGPPQGAEPSAFATAPGPVAAPAGKREPAPEAEGDSAPALPAEPILLARADPTSAKVGPPRAAPQSPPPVERQAAPPPQAKTDGANPDPLAPAPAATVDATRAAVAAQTVTSPPAAPPPPTAPTPKSAKSERAKTFTGETVSVGETKAPQAADKLAMAQAVTPATRLAAREAETADAGGRPANASLDQPDTAAGGETHAATQGSAPLAPAAHAVRGAPETVANLAAQIIKKLEGQSTRFDVELDPQGLGKVNVRIDIGAQGAITAAMSFDNPQAASELRSRAAELQRALEQAGFNLSGGVTFDVAQDRGQQGQAWQQAGQDDNNAGRAFRGQAFQSALDTAGDAADAALNGALRLRRGVNAGLDMRI